MDRRLYFRYLARDTLVWFEELLGRPNVALSDLPKLPDATLATLLPIISPGVEILPEERQVCARPPRGAEIVPLFSKSDATLFVFNRFNGQQTLGAIASELSVAMDWPPERSFAYVKGFFFRLVARRVCVPCNKTPPEIPRETEN